MPGSKTITLQGIILRETPMGESDKMMAVLTAEYGLISVAGRGVRKLNSAHMAATQLYSYTEFVLAKNKDVYNIRETTLKESFYRLHKSLEGLALAGYIAEVACDIATDNSEHTDLIRLVLNSYWAIANAIKPIPQIKAAFEMRCVSLAGFTPDLVGCAGCGNYQFETYYLDVADGTFHCEACFHKASEEQELLAKRSNDNEGIYTDSHLILIFSANVFAALRYTLYAKLERLFAFELEDSALQELAVVSEKYLVYHLERNFATLDFYHSILKN